MAIKEGKERYASKAAMKKHEGKESKTKERKENFRPCKGCPTPAKCKAAGRCLKKGKK